MNTEKQSVSEHLNGHITIVQYHWAVGEGSPDFSL